MRTLSTFVIVASALAAGCGSSSDTPTAPTDYGNSYAITGTVPAPIDGVPQVRTHGFLLSADSSVQVTLTAASETMADGTTLATVALGVGLGTMTNGVCTIVPGAATSTPSGTNVQLVWAMPQGTDCVQLSDVTTQEGPVAYTLSIKY